MKELYRVTYMTENNYNAMMSGSLWFDSTKKDVLAGSEEEAVAIVKKEHPEMIINPYAPTVASIEEAKERFAEERRKEEEKKARKKAYDEAHPEVVAERKRKANIARAKRAIREAEKMKKEAEEAIAYWTDRLAKMEA